MNVLGVHCYLSEVHMIKQNIRSFIPGKLLDRIQRYRKQGRNFKSLATNYGRWTTIRDWNSVDEKGRPIP